MLAYSEKLIGDEAINLITEFWKAINNNHSHYRWQVFIIYCYRLYIVFTLGAGLIIV